MNLEDNPLLQPEDYAKGYKDSVEKLKNDPKLIQMDRLCYEVFQTEMGKKLMSIIEERFLIPSLANRESPTYPVMTIWQDGFKDAFRFLRQAITSHQQRIEAEAVHARKQ